RGDDRTAPGEAYPLEGSGEEVVGEGPLRSEALELHRDRIGFPRPDPDGQVPLAAAFLEDDNVLTIEHVNAHARDHHLHEPVGHSPISLPRIVAAVEDGTGRRRPGPRRIR